MNHFIVDTNVWVTAAGLHDKASGLCIDHCMELLQDPLGSFVIDGKLEVLEEYKRNLVPNSPIWRLLIAHLSASRFHFCDVSECSYPTRQREGDWYDQLPDEDDLLKFDVADRKFLALALQSAADSYSSHLVNATDSDWCILVNFLKRNDIVFIDLCDCCSEK